MCVRRWGAGGWLCVCREMGGRGMVVCVSGDGGQGDGCVCL